MNADQIYLLIVDDDEAFCDVLQKYFEGCEDITVVATATNGAEALDILEKSMVDVVLADIRMPILDGVEFTQAVTERELPCKVLALTMYSDDDAMLRMLQAGAYGYMLKSDRPEEIIQAVRAASNGGTTITPAVATSLRKYIMRPAAEVQDLPDRERDILAHLHRGLSNAEIAAEMDLSAASVKKALSRLYQRFNVTTRMELVAATR